MDIEFKGGQTRIIQEQGQGQSLPNTLARFKSQSVGSSGNAEYPQQLKCMSDTLSTTHTSSRC